MEINTFNKKHDYLVCVDSDGCAMDTMNSKHFKCFGPCMVTEWNLDAWKEEILTRWNDINLYTMTRGINRFLGLATALEEIDKKYTKIEGIAEFVEWTKNAKELSNRAVVEAAKETNNPCFDKAYAWSVAVNESINGLSEEDKQPFANVLEGLKTAHAKADIVVVSSANKEAVTEEWGKHHLLDEVDVLCCQDAGSKAHIIAEMKKKGYEDSHVVMLGDAPGDLAAAEKNGVYFYPILVNKEAESWKEFAQTGLDTFLSGNYAPYGADKKQQFLDNLAGK